MKYQLRRLRAWLGYETASSLERLPIDIIVAMWQAYHLFALVNGQHTGESFTLLDMEGWEKLLGVVGGTAVCAGASGTLAGTVHAAGKSTQIKHSGMMILP